MAGSSSSGSVWPVPAVQSSSQVTLATATTTGATKRGVSSGWSTVSEWSGVAEPPAAAAPVVTRPQHTKIKAETRAVRNAINRNAMNTTDVGPIHGAGSGAPLHYLISSMHSTLERLESLSDATDSDSD